MADTEIRVDRTTPEEGGQPMIILTISRDAWMMPVDAAQRLAAALNEQAAQAARENDR